jgi:hypothetical protein
MNFEMSTESIKKIEEKLESHQMTAAIVRGKTEDLDYQDFLVSKFSFSRSFRIQCIQDIQGCQLLSK